MTEINTFFSMGGYAGYVWSSYLAVVIVLVTLAVVSWRSYRHAERAADTLKDAMRGTRRTELREAANDA